MRVLLSFVEEQHLRFDAFKRLTMKLLSAVVNAQVPRIGRAFELLLPRVPVTRETCMLLSRNRDNE